MQPNTIQFSSSRKCNFSELHIGDFFLAGNTLYVKLGENLAASFLVGSPLAHIDVTGDPMIHQMIIVATCFPPESTNDSIPASSPEEIRNAYYKDYLRRHPRED